jgi:sarcosine oxidase subunit alpha
VSDVAVDERTNVADLRVVLVKSSPTQPAGTADRVGPVMGSSAAVDDALVAGTRPGEWTVIGSPAAVASATDDLAGTDGHVIDLTHGFAVFEVAGPRSAGLLEKVCNVDWTDDMTPDGAVLSASVAKVGCDIIRRDRDGGPAYLVLVDVSYGPYLLDALLDAGQEFTA